jgi:hypothetical protein
MTPLQQRARSIELPENVTSPRVYPTALQLRRHIVARLTNLLDLFGS